jgi:hypothetical protein
LRGLKGFCLGAKLGTESIFEATGHWWRCESITLDAEGDDYPSNDGEKLAQDGESIAQVEGGDV